MIERTALIGSERYSVKWTEAGETLVANVNGRNYQLLIRRLGAGGYWFGWDGHTAEAVVSDGEQGYDVTLGGHRVHIEFPDPRQLRRHRHTTQSGIVEVRAPMPGKIVRILISPGEDVTENQGIVVMEAMKMQNEIRSPKPGKLLELAVVQGNAVGMGDLIARVE